PRRSGYRWPRRCLGYHRSPGLSWARSSVSCRNWGGWPLGRSAAQLGQRVPVILLDLLASILHRTVAQDHALRRLADDLMEGRQQDGVVHRVAALLDELGPFQLALAVRRLE